MSQNSWKITVRVRRQKGQSDAHLQDFEVEVNPDEYVLDVVERIWACHDRTLLYRHACHHSTCGACGMLVNGVEKLTCITPVRSVTHDGGSLRIEPLRNFPVVADLVVDTASLFERIEQTGASQVAPLDKACLPYEAKTLPEDAGHYERLVDCIECGLCISACPPAGTDVEYFGPAVLAAAQQCYTQQPEAGLLDLVDSQDGLWRCHAAYECTAVCPSNVDPGWRIMNLRRIVIGDRIKKFFHA